MRIFLIAIIIAELCLGGYAYSKNPKACMKLAADVVEIFKSPPTSDSPVAKVEDSGTTPSTDSSSVDNTASTPAPAAEPSIIPSSPAIAPTAAPASPIAPTPAPSAAMAQEDPQTMEQDISNQFDMKSITYDEALAQAKAQKKLVLLDFTGSDWCPYCQDLDREVLSSRAFQTYSVSRFVFVVVDFPHDTPLLDDVRQQNDMLKNKYGINGYPTLIVTDANGKELGRTSGYNPGSGSQAVIESLKPFLPN